MAGDFVRPPDSEEKPILSAETVRSFLKTKEPVEVLKKDLPPILDDDAVASFMSDSTEKRSRGDGDRYRYHHDIQQVPGP